jgi:heme A synthase
MLERVVGSNAPRAFRILTWIVLAATVVVVISGDIVQATDSGAGCGESWPRCDGALLPGFDDAATGIEFAHRALTFALTFLMLGLIAMARRTFASGHPVRRAAAYAGAFFVLEILIGALLVVFGWVEDDASVGRVVADGLHVVNTFLLVGALTVIAYHSGAERAQARTTGDRTDRLLLAGLAILLVLGITGAINSLADTLFPPDTVLDGVRDEFGPAAPFLVRIRAVHPVVAIAGGAALFALSRSVGAAAAGHAAVLGRFIRQIIAVQFALGVLNIALLTPLEIQVVHLLAAELLWIAFVLFTMHVRASEVAAGMEAATGVTR